MLDSIRFIAFFMLTVLLTVSLIVCLFATLVMAYDVALLSFLAVVIITMFVFPLID